MTPAPLRGALIGLAGMGLYCLADVTIKFLGSTYSPLQILFCAGLVYVPLILAQSLLRAERLRPARPGLSATRSVTLLLNGTIGAYAFARLPLAESYTVFFLMPLMIAGLAVPFLKERMGWPRAVAICAGFVGVLIALQPGGQTSLGLGHLAAFTAASLGAASYLMLRKMSGVETTGVLLLYPALLQLGFVAAAMPWLFVPMPVSHMLLTGVMGVLIYVGGVLMVLAYRHAPAAVVAPMQYSQIIWAAVLGWLLFGETMDGPMVIGISIIIAAGLFLITRKV